MTNPSERRFPARPLPLAAALAGALALAAAAPQAPVSTPKDRSAVPARDERSEELDRILHLSDGTIVRARARWNAGTWEVKARGGWQPLLEDSVERVQLEREVVARAQDLAREVPRDDDGRRVALADWMLREGLAEEGLRELDRVLEHDPDQPVAVALLAKPPVPLRISLLSSDDPEELLRQSAGAPPSVRELAVRKLAQVEAAAPLRERLAATLQSHSARLRVLAAVGLRRLYPGEEVRGLVVRSVLDGSEDVRRQASLSLKAVGDAAVILPAVRALESGSGAVRENAIEALGTMGYPAALPALISRLSAVTSPQGGGDARPPRAHIFVGQQHAYIQDFDVEVAQGAAIADPIINTLTEGSVLDVRVIGVNVVQSMATESRQLRRSLARLTGEERSSKGWLEWWSVHEHDFAPASAPPTPSGPSTAGG